MARPDFTWKNKPDEKEFLRCFEVYLQGNISLETIGAYYGVTRKCIAYRFKKLAMTDNGQRVMAAMSGGDYHAAKRESE